jgi:hypothetical protein
MFVSVSHQNSFGQRHCIPEPNCYYYPLTPVRRKTMLPKPSSHAEMIIHTSEIDTTLGAGLDLVNVGLSWALVGRHEERIDLSFL